MPLNEIQNLDPSKGFQIDAYGKTNSTNQDEDNGSRANKKRQFENLPVWRFQFHKAQRSALKLYV